MHGLEPLTYPVAEEKFISEWGTLCTKWGVNKTMGQIHAVLLISSHAMCSDQVMQRLDLSRGNVNMNIRALEQWQLIHRIQKIGERKDYYEAEKDFNKVFKIIITERRKQELDPLVNLLKELDKINPVCQESQEFCKVTKELNQFAQKADHALNAITGGNLDWLSKIFLR